MWLGVNQTYILSHKRKKQWKTNQKEPHIIFNLSLKTKHDMNPNPMQSHTSTSHAYNFIHNSWN